MAEDLSQTFFLNIELPQSELNRMFKKVWNFNVVVNIKTESGKPSEQITPLIAAILAKKSNMIEKILRNPHTPTNPNFPEPKFNLTPLHYIITFLPSNEIENPALDLLLREKNIRVDKPDLYGKTPLITAAKNGNAIDVSKLLEAKANPLLKDNQGEIALEYALKIYPSMLPVISLLIKNITTETAEGITSAPVEIVDILEAHDRSFYGRHIRDTEPFSNEEEIMESNNSGFYSFEQARQSTGIINPNHTETEL